MDSWAIGFATVATHEPSQSALSRPSRVGIDYRKRRPTMSDEPEPLMKVSPEMEAAWVAYEPSGRFAETKSFAGFNGALRSAFYAGWVANDSRRKAALAQIDRAFGKGSAAKLGQRAPAVEGEERLRAAIADSLPEEEAPKDLLNLGFEIVGFVSQFADERTSVDRGCGLGQFDCQVTIGGLEYDITITAPEEEDEAPAIADTHPKGHDREAGHGS